MIEDCVDHRQGLKNGVGAFWCWSEWMHIRRRRWELKIEQHLEAGKSTPPQWEIFRWKEGFLLVEFKWELILPIDAFEPWCWRRLLRVPWTARRSNQSILKEINSEYSMEGLMLKLQYLGHLKWRDDSLEKTPMLGKTEGKRRRGRQRMRCLDGITKSMNRNLSTLREMVKDREA